MQSNEILVFFCTISTRISIFLSLKLNSMIFLYFPNDLLNIFQWIMNDKCHNDNCVNVIVFLCHFSMCFFGGIFFFYFHRFIYLCQAEKPFCCIQNHYSSKTEIVSEFLLLVFSMPGHIQCHSYVLQFNVRDVRINRLFSSQIMKTVSVSQQ